MARSYGLRALHSSLPFGIKLHDDVATDLIAYIIDDHRTMHPYSVLRF